MGPTPSPKTKSARPRAMTPSAASANVLPIVGCPAIGSSVPGREDPHPHVSPGDSGGKNERALGEVHLARDGLHLFGGQAPRFRKHGELIAFERRDR